MSEAAERPATRVLGTPRLTLVAAGVEHCQAELAGGEQLARLLQARVPPDWPPPLADLEALCWYHDYLLAHPGAEGWGLWYCLSGEPRARTLVGEAGFKGLPTPQGEVEVGYSVVPAAQGRGLATEAVAALVDWAFGHNEVRVVLAHTLPDNRPSLRVLEKLGFRSDGPGIESGTVRFLLERAATSAFKSESLGGTN
ncbi:MAG: GNAT family N-acetyltransferase [Thermoanaerobaculia bacterium]